MDIIPGKIPSRFHPNLSNNETSNRYKRIREHFSTRDLTTTKHMLTRKIPISAILKRTAFSIARQNLELSTKQNNYSA